MAESERVVFAFTTGLVSPIYDARADVEKLGAACRTLQNMTLGAFGYAERRAGTQFVAEVGVAYALADDDGVFLVDDDGQQLIGDSA